MAYGHVACINRRRLWLGMLAFLAACAAAAQEAAPTPPPDTGAQIFSQKCVGCHSIGGGVLIGPDLKPVQPRPRADIEAAVERMSKSVGPLSPEEVQALSDLLQSTDAAARVQKQQEQAILARTATLKPGDPKIGQALFQGLQPLSGGGVACAACHTAGGRGGSLAVPLEDAFTRLGEPSILSTCGQPVFPAMRAVYIGGPVTPQEAAHIAKYLESVSANPVAPATVPLGMTGSLGAVAGLVGIGFAYRRRPGGTVRKRMVQETMAGTRHGRSHEGSNR